MTTLSYQALSEKLAAGSIEFVGNNQVKANFSQILGAGDLTLESSCVEGVVKFLEGLANLTDQVNSQRIQDNLPPVEFISKILTGTPEQPIYEFRVIVKVDTSHFSENLTDPTE